MGGFIAQLAKSVLAQPNSASSRFAACLLKSLRFDPHKSDRLLDKFSAKPDCYSTNGIAMGSVSGLIKSNEFR